MPSLTESSQEAVLPLALLACAEAFTPVSIAALRPASALHSSGAVHSAVFSPESPPSDDHEEEGDKVPDMIFKACVRDETIGGDLLYEPDTRLVTQTTQSHRSPSESRRFFGHKLGRN